MRAGSLVTVVACLALAAACGGPSTPPAALDPGAVVPLQTRTTVAAVLGTLHEGHLQGGYPLSTVEYVVRSFRPDVVLVEVPPDAMADAIAAVDAEGDAASRETLDDRWVRDQPELYAVVIPLRHELGYAVEGISGWTAEAYAARDAYYLGNPHGPMQRQYIVANAAFHATFLEHGGASDAAWLHSDEFLEASTDATTWLAYFAEDEMGPGGELHVQARHSALLNDALDAHRGERVLVVFDVNARWGLEPTIDVRGDVHRVETAAFLP